MSDRMISLYATARTEIEEDGQFHNFAVWEVEEENPVEPDDTKVAVVQLGYKSEEEKAGFLYDLGVLAKKNDAGENLDCRGYLLHVRDGGRGRQGGAWRGVDAG